MSFKISNPFLRKSSSPLNTNHGAHNQDYKRYNIRPEATMQIKELPKWVLDKRANLGKDEKDPLRFLSEEEQSLMSDEDRYNYYEAMLIAENNRIAQLEQNVRDFAASTYPEVDETGKPIPRSNDSMDFKPSAGDVAWRNRDDRSGDIFTENYPKLDEALVQHNVNMRQGVPGYEDKAYFCQTMSCAMLAQNGYTLPRDINGDGIVDDTDTYEGLQGGDALPIEPGTAKFNANATKLGFTVLPVGTTLDKNKVQHLRRSTFDYSPEHDDLWDPELGDDSPVATSMVDMYDPVSGVRYNNLPADHPSNLGHGHSMTSLGMGGYDFDRGTPDDTSDDVNTGLFIHNPGGSRSRGLQIYGDYRGRDTIYQDKNNDGLADMDTDGNTWRIMDYTGDMPYWQKKIEGMKDWKTKFDADKIAKEKETREMLGLPSTDNPMYKF
ncbi:hypothetical protein CMO95_03620 [Candidatus Woesearchaeota archaeon]|nr:hypothetical protein [Candidatus Woesearchaeota archaeon]